MRFSIQAYIRRMGALVESVCLNVAAESAQDACNKVRNFYAQRGLDAGINEQSIREMVDFEVLANT